MRARYTITIETRVTPDLSSSGGSVVTNINDLRSERSGRVLWMPGNRNIMDCCNKCNIMYYHAI